MADAATGEYPPTTAAPRPCPACGGGVTLRAVIPASIAAALPLARNLTPRERAVFQLLGFGYDNRSIARACTISERTVKRYVTAILAKLKLESRLQAGLTALTISSSAAADPYWAEIWPEGRMDTPAAGRETYW